MYLLDIRPYSTRSHRVDRVRGYFVPFCKNPGSFGTSADCANLLWIKPRASTRLVVFATRHWFQVIGINAVRHVAQVMQVKTNGNSALCADVHEPVRPDTCAPMLRASVVLMPRQNDVAVRVWSFVSNPAWSRVSAILGRVRNVGRVTDHAGIRRELGMKIAPMLDSNGVVFAPMFALTDEADFSGADSEASSNRESSFSLCERIAYLASFLKREFLRVVTKMIGRVQFQRKMLRIDARLLLAQMMDKTTIWNRASVRLYPLSAMLKTLSVWVAQRVSVPLRTFGSVPNPTRSAVSHVDDGPTVRVLARLVTSTESLRLAASNGSLFSAVALAVSVKGSKVFHWIASFPRLSIGAGGMNSAGPCFVLPFSHIRRLSPFFCATCFVNPSTSLN